MSSVYDLDEPLHETFAAPAARRSERFAFALGAAALVVGLGAWLAAQAPVPTAPRLAAIGERAASAAAEVVEAAEPVATFEASAVDAETIEVCGLGRVARDALEGARGGPELLDAPLREAERRTIERLLARSDERSRAAGQFLRAATLGIDNSVTHLERLRDEGIDCAQRSCDAPPIVDEVTRARAALATLAVGTRDAWVYALAYQSCTTEALMSGPVPACQLISVERWTQLEPDNAIAWLHAVDVAKQRGDEAAVAEALYRASQAKRADTRFGQLGAVARQQEPGDVAPAVGWLLDAKSLGLDAAFAIPGYQIASQHCSKDALVDPNRRAVCDALALMLVERSTSLADMSMGLALAKRLEWPARRLESLEASRDALYAVALDGPEAASDGSPRLDCEAVAAQRERARRVAALGELGALRQQLAQSGLDAAPLAARHRAWLARLRAAAAAPAASAAAAANGMLRTASTP